MIVRLHTLDILGPSSTFEKRAGLDKGVAFFFVLSGFIMMYVYPSLDIRGGIRFIVARIARIWPMHAIVLLIIFVRPRPEGFLAETYEPRWVLLNLSLLHYWFPNKAFSLNPVTWTLSIELFFYAAFPFLLWRWQRAWRWIVLVACGYTAVCVIIGYLVGAWTPQPLRVEPRPSDFFKNGPVSFLFPFVLGMAMATLWRKAAGRIVVSRAIGTCLEAAAELCAVAATILSAPIGDLSERVWWIGIIGATWIRTFYVVVVPYAVVIFVIALERGWISRLLAYRPFVLLGEISYSLYLVHWAALGYYVTHTGRFFWIPAGHREFAYWIFILLLSSLGWVTVERPCRRWILAWWDRHMVDAKRYVPTTIVPEESR